EVSSLADFKIVEVVQKMTKPYEKVFVYPYSTGVYFLSQTWFPSRYPLVQYRFNSPGQIQEAIDDIERSRVDVVVWDLLLGNVSYSNPGFPLGEVSKEDQIVEAYLLKHFDFVKEYGRYRLMKRKPTAAQ